VQAQLRARQLAPMAASYASGQGSYGSYGGQGVGVEGSAVVEDLLRRPPVEVANWALDQAKDLGQPGVNVEQMPIFKLAGILNSLPKDKKQVLVQRAVSGFGDLPVQRRAEAVRLAMKSSDIIQKADNLEVHRMAQREHAAAMNRLRALEQRQADAQGGQSNFQSASGVGQADQLEMGQQDPLVENILRVAKEARFNEMPRDELTGMAQAAQGEAQRLIQPQQLLDVVSELNPNEREQLTEALVEARVVPEEQRGVLEEAVRPGGYADKLGGALRMANQAQRYAWVFIVIPIVEFVLALIFGYFACGTPLVAWLRFDALLALCMAGAVYFTGHTLAPVYQKLNEDPVGAVQRWQSVADVPSWKVRLETAVPGVDFETYRAGAAGLAATVILILVGAVWAVVGVLELLATVIMGCSVVTTFFCVIFIGMRFACVVGMLWGLYEVLDEIQRHRSRSPMLGSALLPMSEDAFPRNGSPPQGAYQPAGYPQQGAQYPQAGYPNAGYNANYNSGYTANYNSGQYGRPPPH